MEIKQLLAMSNFRFNRKLGQNFITDTNLLAAIVNDAGICEEDVVIEIGAGAGTLTRELSKRAKAVTAIEVDASLEEVLSAMLLPCKNVNVMFGDALKLGIEEIERLAKGKPYKVVANLPYYITTPIIMMFVEKAKKCQSVTVMVQKEVADRLSALPGTEEYGAITASLNLSCNVKQTRKVSREMFYPVPNVDSAVVRIDFVNKFPNADLAEVRKLIRQAFLMRRKTLVNNLLNLKPKQFWEDKLAKMSLPLDIRGEVLSAEQFVELAKD